MGMDRGITTSNPGFSPGQRPAEQLCMAAESDEQLMLAYAAGDAGAFDRLYQNYRAPLYRFILRQVKDPVACNDLYQQCWEKLIKARHTYRSKSPFPAWLFRIARNTVIDYFRRQASYSPTVLPELPSETAGPEQLAQQDQAERNLAAAIDALPAEQREVVLLRIEAGLDLVGIARITGSNAETCKSRLRYALAKLKQQMKDPNGYSGGHDATDQD
jgi:RNA polymerase sigma-70 factor (ECF subfamily)